MPATEGCDLIPFRAAPVEGAVAIPFARDYEIEAGFVRDGVPLWSNAGAPVRLSQLIAEEATSEDLAQIARDLALTLIRRRAEAAIATQE